MNLGFIGTGNIVSDVITGISKSKIKYKKIIISPRNKKKALFLKRYFKKVIIAKDNQEVIDKADWIFLGILPKVGEEILPKLQFRNKQIIISFMSNTSFSTLFLGGFLRQLLFCYFKVPKNKNPVVFTSYRGIYTT